MITPKTQMRLEIAGGIAAGKTTLALLLDQLGICASLENFEDNPFLRDFYHSPLAYAFETEMSFLLQHYHQIKARRSQGWLACDFSFSLDAAYADVTLEGRKQELFSAVREELVSNIHHPDLIIYLECDAKEEIARIGARAREMEHGIGIGYLEALNEALKARIAEAALYTPVLALRSDRLDFANNPNTRSDLAASLSALLL